MDDLINRLQPYPQPLSQPVPNRIWLHDLGGGDITWCDDPQPAPGEDMENVAYIRVDAMYDALADQAADIAALRVKLDEFQTGAIEQMQLALELNKETIRLREALAIARTFKGEKS